LTFTNKQKKEEGRLLIFSSRNEQRANTSAQVLFSTISKQHKQTNTYIDI